MFKKNFYYGSITEKNYTYKVQSPFLEFGTKLNPPLRVKISNTDKSLSISPVLSNLSLFKFFEAMECLLKL